MPRTSLAIRSLLVVGLTLAGLASPLEAAARFRRGDSNADGFQDISDAVHALSFLFLGAPERLPCLDAADSNDDGLLDIADPVRSLLRLFGSAGPLPPPSGGGLLDCGDDPTADELDCEEFAPCPAQVPAPAPPVLLPLASPTREASVEVQGTAGAGLRVRVIGGRGSPVETVAGPDGIFAAAVNLLTNRLSRLAGVAIDAEGRESAPATVEVVHDAEPPFVRADEPLDGATVITERIAITGRVADVLSGFLGLGVTVNGVSAAIAIGIGTNGTFERLDVPLALGENTLAVVATDAAGNSASHSIRVTRQEPPAGADLLEMVSGTGQPQRPIHATLPQPIVVRARDAAGEPLEGRLVTFRVARSDGLLAASPGASPGDRARTLAVLTGADGLAAAAWTLGSDAGCGNNRVKATGAGMAGEVLFCASAAPGPAAQINVGIGQNQRGEAGAPAREPLRAWVSDGCNGIPGVPVTFRVAMGTGRVDGASQVTVPTGPTGHAQAAFTFGPEAGMQAVEATFSRADGQIAPPAVFLAVAVVRDESRPTAFSGLVLDNSEQPIEGAVCVLGRAGAVGQQTTTDARGQFRLDDVSTIGPALLIVDGAPATARGGQAVPPGSFPVLSYEVTVVPNAENSLPSPVLLPLLDPDNAVVHDGSGETVLRVKGVEGLEMHIAAGTVITLLDGTRVGPGLGRSVRLSLNQVHHDDVPMPMPDGAAPPFAWTLQPGGARFDPPVKVKYPNMSGLPPGAIANFLTFNHDTGKFEIVSSGQVSADGSSIDTDPGSGLRVAGWGCNCPPYSVTADCEHCGAGIEAPGGIICVDQPVTISGSGGPAPGTLVLASSGEPASASFSFGGNYGSVGGALETRFKTPGKKTATATWNCSTFDLKTASVEFTVHDLKLHPVEEDFSPVGPRVMISTTQDAAYHTVKNTTLAGTPAQTKDGEVTITFQGAPAEGLTGKKIYFRVAAPDPDDRSPYEVAAGAPDNRDLAFQAGTLSAQEAVLQTSVLDGKEVAAAETILTITRQSSGDNYQVEASLESDFKRICARTAVLVAWKRVYIEEDSMYTRGATLVADFVPDADGLDDVLTVDNSSDFTVGELAMVFSRTASLPTAVTAVAPGRVTVGDLAMAFPRYSGIRPLVGVGTVSLGTHLLPATFGGDTPGMDGGAFVEFVLGFTGGSAIPKYTAFPNDVESIAFCRSWFDNSASSANVFQLVGALGHADGSLGTTDPAINICFITTSNFSGGILDPLGIAEAVSHEIAHQFGVANGHVDQFITARNHAGTDECIMSYSQRLNDLIAEFDLDCIYDVRDAGDPR